MKLHFVNLTDKMNKQENTDKYLFYYEIKDTTNIIASSYIIKDVLIEDVHVNLLEIHINSNNSNNILYYRNILTESTLKYINLGNTKLNIIVPKTSYYEILILLSEFYKFEKDISNKKMYHFMINDVYKLTMKSKIDKNIKYDLPKLKGYGKSYIISAAKLEGLMFSTLQNYLNNNGQNEIYNYNTTPFLLWIELMENKKYDSKYFNTRCYIMNLLNDNKNIICDKSNLYKNFKKYYPADCIKYMAESWNLTEFIANPKLLNRIQNNEVFIIRPVNSFSGKDIYVVENLSQLNSVKVNLLRKYQTVLISKYITNSLLLDNRKFHVRIYFLVGVIENTFVTKILDFYEIFSAKKAYKNSNFLDKDIHDTHSSSSDKDILYPFDIIDSNIYNDFESTYIPKIKDCLLLVSKFIKGRVAPYTQAKNAFEIFGCDFLITEDGNIVLMEINDRVGYGTISFKYRIKFSKTFFDFLIEYIFDPILKNTPIENNDWLYLSKLK
jgi:hypothetical protein